MERDIGNATIGDFQPVFHERARDSTRLGTSYAAGASCTVRATSVWRARQAYKVRHECIMCATGVLRVSCAAQMPSATSEDVFIGGVSC